MLDRSHIDLSGLPQQYLQSYPYPAFVLIAPIPPISISEEPDDFSSPTPTPDAALPFTPSDHGTLQPFDVVWANDKWKNLTQGANLLNCLDVQGARNLGDWVGGIKTEAQRIRGASLGTIGRSAFTAGSTAARSPEEVTFAKLKLGQHLSKSNGGSMEPPENFWEPERPYEDRSAKSDGVSSADVESTGIEGTDGVHPGPSTLTIDLVFPGRVTLEMTKVILPASRISRSGLKSQLKTHSFTVITTTPRSAFVPNHAEAHLSPNYVDSPVEATFPSMSSSPPGPVRPSYPRTTTLSPTAAPTTSNDKRPSFLNSHPSSSPIISPVEELKGLGLLSPRGKPSRPLMFSVDGTVSRSTERAAGNDAEGRSLDVSVLMETTDWSKTPLGPRELWPQSLKTIVSLVLNYPHQSCLWWGPELTLIYNEPYAQAIHKHPSLFGMSGPVAWSEIWASLGPLSEVVLKGTPVWKEDDFLLFKQLPHQGDGVFEEYHTWMWVPVQKEDGTAGGLWNATIRTTEKVLVERRLATVREMGQRTSIARTKEEFITGMLDILGSNPKDIPFAALYDVQTTTQKKDGPYAAEIPVKADAGEVVQVDAELVGSIGIPDNHPSTPSHLSFPLRHRRTSTAARFTQGGGLSSSPALSVLSSFSSSGIPPQPLADSDHSFPPPVDQWPIREALQSRRLILVEDCSAFIQDFPIRVWDELPNAAVVVPISSDSDEGVPTSVLVLGLNIRRPFDEPYESFVLASCIAAVRSYEAERQQVDELAALDRAKSVLFSNISHELRTPLTLVSGPIDDILRDTPDGQRKDTLMMVRRNVRRLSRLVSTLMDVSRLEAGRMKGTFRPVNLGLLTRDLSMLFKAAIEKAGLKYVVEVDTSNQAAYIDPEHWEKIVFNLIGNAMKYTMSGFVRVKLSYTEEDAILSVQDSGVGIPHSDIGLIGERFHRVQSVSRSHEGTGIGLALTKELVALHGGRLEVESSTVDESVDGSHGSTFRARIPLGADHLNPDSIDTGRLPNSSELTYGQGMVDEAMQWVRDGNSVISSDDSTAALSGDSSGPSSKAIDPSTLYFQKNDVIMLVEDSADTRRYMKSIFSQYCTVVEAHDGKEALELCAKQIPDLVISDVMMPNLDGFGLLQAMKESKELRVVPVIILTARGTDDSKVSGIMAGADDYLAKPFNAREIVARAHMQLQLGKKIRHLEEAFEERTAELRVLAEYSPAGIFRADQSGTLTWANPSWYGIANYPTDQPCDQIKWVEYVVEHQQEAVMDFWRNALSSTEVSQTGDWEHTNGRWTISTGGGAITNLSRSTIIRLDLIQPGLKGLLGCVTDITERKLRETFQRQQVVEAEQRRADAEEAKRQQELLIDITSHEIRNPISSVMQISSLTNLLSLQEQLVLSIENKTAFTPTRQLMNNIEEDLEALESIYQCGLSQERISNDVLSLGRIQLDMLQMFDVEFDMIREAQNILSVFQNEARMKRINLTFKAGDSLQKLGLRWAKADLVRLNQITTNLLSNAIRFTATSEVRKIVLQTEASFEPPVEGTCVMPREPTRPKKLTDDMPMYLYASVADTGPGLAEDEVQKLFQRFSQVSPKTHTIFGGSGLGLFVCRKLTELMGGGIEVISEKGKGSTFRFYIEAKTCHTAPTRESSRPRTRIPKDSARYFGLSRKPHVLIVEDNLINQTVLARQLKHCNLTCDVANNGLEALEKIRKVSSIGVHSEEPAFDCVLMDLEMPVMDGLTAVKHIREEETSGKLHRNLVIALTGNARQGQIDEAKASGMDEVVIKPYRLDDLLHKIEEMMKIRAAEEDEADARADAEDAAEAMRKAAEDEEEREEANRNSQTVGAAKENKKSL
ncbi:hypothetical protein IAT38_003969 [Cryptococcus sp. DSM 104549]